MLPNTSLPESSFPDFMIDFGFATEVWWLLLGLFTIVSVIFFIVVLYHWLRYETNSVFSSVVIVTNGIVLAILLGGATINLNAYLATL